MQRLNQESIQVIQEVVSKHKDKQGPCIMMLHEIQDELGYIPFEAMEEIAKATSTSVADVYGVVCFYAGFTTIPKGKHVINVCMGTACYVKGSQVLVDTALEMTGASVNGTSPDGMFSIDATRCLGACGLAPVVVIDGNVVGNCSKEMLVKEIKAIQASEGII